MHRLVIVDLVENGKFLVRLQFEDEGQSGGQQNGDKDTDGLEENRQ